jgi:hypothetical protein
LAVVLTALWVLIFWPMSKSDILAFLIASIFIIGQNYIVLQNEQFIFSHQDFLLMPYYEPLLWGFYLLNLKRFFAEQKPAKKIGLRPIWGLVLLSLTFGIFSRTDWHTMAVFAATGILLLLFHSKQDIQHGLYALGMGFVVETFGVTTGHWSYPDPDLLGIPYWFAPMWISVGLLGRRFLFPLVHILDQKLPTIMKSHSDQGQ